MKKLIFPILAYTLTALCAVVLLISCSDDNDPPATYAVGVTADTGGTASADKTNPAESETVTLTAAITEPGYIFKQWTVTSGTITLLPNAEANPATFVMPAGAVSIKAEFLAPVLVTAGTGGTASADKTNPAEGETVTLTAAITEPGYTFDRWTVTSGTITLLPNAEANPATFVMPAGAVSIKAEFLVPGEVYGIAAVKIPAGTFLMGSSDGSNYPGGVPGIDLNATPAEPDRAISETQHWVTLTKDFWISKYQITNAQYAEFLNAKSIGSDGSGSVEYDNDGSTHIYTGKLVTGHRHGVRWETDEWVPAAGYEDYPVVYVSWYGAKAYADWIGGSLPTEAQWEYACRGGEVNKPFGIGDGTKLTYGMANFDTDFPYDMAQGGHYEDLTGTSHVGITQAVGSYPYANGYGLYDMHGNLSEWCSDWYEYYYYSDSSAGTDPTGPAVGSGRVHRGGSWGNFARRCRSACRSNYNPVLADYIFGFRIVFVQ